MSKIPCPRKPSGLRKPNASSVLARLAPEQRDKLIEWLFRENKGYLEVVELCKKEFQIDTHSNSLVRFYKKEIPKRILGDISASKALAREIEKAAGENPDLTFRALLKMIQQICFDVTLAVQLGRTPNLTPLINLLPFLLDARKDARDDRKSALDREQWEFDVVRACHDHFNELQTIIGNQAEDEPSRLQAIRRRLFGKNLGEDEKQWPQKSA